MYQYKTQVKRLRRLGIPELLGLKEEKLHAWLASFGIGPSLFRGKERTVIVLPAGLAKGHAPGAYWTRLFPQLELDDGITEEIMTGKQNGQAFAPYVLRNVSFGIWNQYAERLVENWTGLTKELDAADRVGLTGEELVTLLAYDSNRFDAMLAIDSIADGMIPCLSPVANRWRLAPRLINRLMDQKTGRWFPPLGGSCAVVAPTAKRFIPA